MSLADLSLRSVKIRLFLTCWMVYVLHFATDFVREHYLVPEHRGGPHLPAGSVPGDARRTFSRTRRRHPMAGLIRMPIPEFPSSEPFPISSPNRRRSRGREDPRRARGRPTPRPSTTIRGGAGLSSTRRCGRLGLDVRFGWSARSPRPCMAPLSAYSAVVIFGLLGHLGLGRRVALALTFLYAFGTPVFFRTAFLNQNLGIGVASLLAFRADLESRWAPPLVASNSIPARRLPGRVLPSHRLQRRTLPRAAWAFMRCGSGETSHSFGRDSGLLVVRRRRHPTGSDAVLLPMGIFGDWFHPAQHWMPPVEGTDVGYKGVGGLSQSWYGSPH